MEVNKFDRKRRHLAAHSVEQKMERKTWTREAIIVAFAMYCVTPMSKINRNNKLIQEVAELIGYPLGSLVARMQNFRTLDPRMPSGLGHTAKMDKAIYEEFRHDWGELSVQAEQITGLDLFSADPINGAKRISDLTDHKKVTRERYFFRIAVLSAYEYRCCISGQTLPNMLVASHIKPYKACRSSNDRITPENGLCLNVFYDKAFDSGLITVDHDLTIRVSKKVDDYADAFTEKWLIGLRGESILLPERFRPQKEFLEYHNKKVFKG